MAASDITVSGLRRSISCIENTYYSGLSEGGHPIPRFHAGVG